MPSLDPPKSPLRRGVGVDFDRILVPPFLRGARGDLDLMVKQPSLTGLELKLTPMGNAVSYGERSRGILHKRGICCKYKVFKSEFLGFTEAVKKPQLLASNEHSRIHPASPSLFESKEVN